MKDVRHMAEACGILIVEDDADQASSLRDVLLAQGYEVDMAGDGAGAVAMCASKAFDLALIDIKLPDFGGVELVERLAELTPRTEYVIITGRPSLESAVASVGHKQIVSYETKPLDLGRLTSLLSQVAQRREAERTAEASVRTWQVTFDAVKDTVCIIDSECRIVQYNEAMRRLVDRSPEEMVGGPCYGVVHGAARPFDDCPVERMKESHCRETLVLPRGDRWFEVSADPLVDESGRVTGAVHIMRDVTEWKEAEEAVRKERDLAQK